MVTVRTGQISSLIGKDRRQWDGVVADWVRISAIGFPDDCRSLLQMRDECRAVKLWEAFGYEDENQFFREKLFLTPEAVDFACSALQVSDPKKPISLGSAVSLGERAKESKRLVMDEGKTQAEAAEILGVSHQTIGRDLSRNTVQTPKVDKPRKVIQYTITQYTTPETAAAKIREKFGDEFASELKRHLGVCRDENI